MKVIYHDKMGRHLAIIAAARHLQLIDVQPSRNAIGELPYFLHQKPPGSLLYLGLDGQGHEVYVLGRNNSFPIIRNAFLGLDRIFALNQEYLFANVEPIMNLNLFLFDLLNGDSKKKIRYISFLYRGLKTALPRLEPLTNEVKRKLQGGS